MKSLCLGRLKSKNEYACRWRRKTNSYRARPVKLGCRKLFFFFDVKAYPTTTFCAASVVVPVCFSSSSSPLEISPLSLILAHPRSPSIQRSNLLPSSASILAPLGSQSRILRIAQGETEEENVWKRG